MIYKSQQEIQDILEGGALLGKVMDVLISKVAPGVTTLELDKLAYDLIVSYGGRPSFLNSQPSFADKPFPATLCTSINEGVVHTPATLNVTLQEGDVLKLDLGMEYKGLYTDMARTVPVGKISREAKLLLSATQQALEDAIASLEVGQSLYSIGPAVKKVADEHKLGIVRDLVGHGVGTKIHEDP
ncbi:M24 family metallopeptidase, partial [Candidatus Falkowbacteria bacterium]|nr:M24 family metallopeptidase [Candidatus Falkowbacteria bacterium]